MQLCDELITWRFLVLWQRYIKVLRRKLTTAIQHGSPFVAVTMATIVQITLDHTNCQYKSTDDLKCFMWNFLRLFKMPLKARQKRTTNGNCNCFWYVKWAKWYHMTIRQNESNPVIWHTSRPPWSHTDINDKVQTILVPGGTVTDCYLSSDLKQSCNFGETQLTKICIINKLSKPRSCHISN